MRISVATKDGSKWLRKIKKRFEKCDAVVEVGVFPGSTNQETGMSVVEYAIYNEFGTSGTHETPARAFMRYTFDSRRAEWYRLLHKLMQSNQYDARAALMLVAEVAVKDIQQTISTAGDGSFEPNSPETVARKAAKGKRYPDQPLIDTGSLQEAIRYEMRE